MSNKDFHQEAKKLVEQSVFSLNQGRVDRALNALNKAKYLLEKLPKEKMDERLLVDILRKISALYIPKNMYKESLEVGKQALPIAEKLVSTLNFRVNRNFVS